MPTDLDTSGRTSVARHISGPFRKLLFALGGLAILWAAAVGVMSTAWFREAIERRVASTLENLTGGRIVTRGLRFNPAILQIRVQGLTLHGTELGSEPPLFTARTIVVRLSPLALLRRRLSVRRLEWANAEIHLFTRPDGSTNIPGPRASLQAGQAIEKLVDLSIGALVLARTEISWNNQRVPLDLDVRDVAILLHFSRPAHYTGSLSTSAARIKTARWSSPPLAFASRFEFSRGKVTVDPLEWRFPGMKGSGTISLSNLAAPEGLFSYSVRGEIPELVRILDLRELRNGTINLEGQAVYRPGEVSARGRIQGRDLTIRPSVFDPGRMDFSGNYLADLDHIEVSDLALRMLGGIAQGRLEISLRDRVPGFAWHTQLRGFDTTAALSPLSRHHRILRLLHPVTKIDGTALATWSGRLKDFKSEFKLQLRAPANHVPGSMPVAGEVRGQVAMAKGLVLDLSEARIQTPHSTLSTQGRLGARQSNLGFRLVTSDFEEWRAITEFYAGSTKSILISLDSPTVLSGTAFGAFDRLEFRGRIEAETFTFRDWKWDKLSAGFVLGPKSIGVSSGRLQRGTSALILDASSTLEDWMLTPHSLVHFSAQAQRTPLEGLKAALGIDEPFRGLATGQLNFEGTAGNLTGRGALRVEQGSVADEPFDLFSAKIRIASSTLSFENIELTNKSGRLTGQLWIDPSHRSFSAEFHGAGFALADFNHLLVTGPPPGLAPRLVGFADFDGQGSGTAEDMRLHAKWKIRDLRLDNNAIGDAQGQIEWQGKQMRLEGLCQGSGGLVRFSGEVRPEAGWPLDLTGQYQGLRADPWIHLFLKSKSDALVTASGSFKLTGPLKEPGRLQAQMQAQELAIVFPSLTWKNEHAIDLRYADGTLTAARFRMRGPSTNLEVEGSIRFAPQAALSLNAQGQADAALLSLLDPAIQATGRSELTLRVSGNPARPLLNGSLNVRDVGLSYGDLPFRVAGLNGEIRLEGERATARSLHGTAGGGSVTLSGYVTISETPRYDLQADLDSVRVRYPSDFTSVLNGSLYLMGTSEKGQFRGELTVRQMFVSESFNLVARLVTGVSPFKRELTGITSPLSSRIRLNIQVISAPPIRLETRDWRLLADLDIRLQGTLASPVEVGIIHFRTGEAVFRGTRYKLTRGEISMSSPFRTQPALDLEASTRIQRYDLTVDVSGPLDRLKVAYRSDPPLPVADILSLLALGFSRQQEGMSTTAGQPLPTVEAGALLSQALSSEVSGRVQRLFGVSHVKIDPNVGGPGNPGGARVTVEQQVTRDFTLTYVTNTASSQYRVIQFEWALSENTSLVGVRDQNGIFGVEVKFRHRFK